MRGLDLAAIGNAGRALELIGEHGSLAAFLAGFVPQQGQPPRVVADVPASTEESAFLSRALKHRGWAFVGPTTVYASMQAVGMVNDHLMGCFVREECAAARQAWKL